MRTDPIDITTASDIEQILIRLIKNASSQDPTCAVEPRTIPSLDIGGFDSLNTLEVLTELEEETGIHVENDVFYVDLKPRKDASIHEIALAIWSEIQKAKINHA